MPSVDILLATYNGARFLPAQLASLSRQSHRDWRLIVRDDGSSDGSLDIVRQWADREQRALLVVVDGIKGLGPAQSFGRLLDRSDAPYFAFCDQDDVWDEVKVQRLLAEVLAMEADHGLALPMLAHSNLAIVDEDLTPTGANFWEGARIVCPNIGRSEPDKAGRASLLLQNVVTGCASLGNSSLRQVAGSMPEGVHVHDWWVALIAAHFGAVRGVPETLVQYRQHSGNAIGAKPWGAASIGRRFLPAPGENIRKAAILLEALQRQAGSFADAFGKVLPQDDRETVQELATLRAHSILRRKTFMSRRGAYPQSMLRGLALLCVI